MSDRPTTGRPRRGASRATGAGDPPDVHPATDAGAPALNPEETDRASSRSNLRVVNGNTTGSRKAKKRPPPNETRIMSAEEVDEEDEDDGPPDGEATHAGPPITIEVIEGPDAGKKKGVRGGRMVIGRGDGCDLKLRDTATSRRHMEIIVGFSGVVVRDLGSGNGTKVNGKKVDEAQVGHGDEITVGTTMLKIIDEVAELEARRRPKEPEPPPEVEPADDESVPPTEAPRRPNSRAPARDSHTGQVSVPMEPESKRNTLLLAGLGVGGLLLVVILVMLLRPSPPPGVGRVPVNGGPSADDAAIAAVMTEGKKAIGDADYDKAMAAWDQLEKLDPHNADLNDLRARTTKEREAKNKYATAQGLMAEHRFDDAREALKAVPADSLVSDPAGELLKTLDAKQSEFVAGQVLLKVQSGDIAGARAGVPDLARLDPTRAAEVTKAIDAAQAEADKEALKNVKNKKQRERLAKEMKKRKADDAVRGELMSGFRKFQEAGSPGGYDRAANEFEHIAESTANPGVRSKAQALAQRVRAFSRNLQDADSLDGDQSYEAEVAPLEKAINALEELEPSGPEMTRLKNRIVRGLVIKGRNAAARQDYVVASKSFTKALQVHPGDSNAKEGMQNLKARAQEVYLQAYEEEARDPDSAKKLYKAVIEMAGSNEELHGKAQKRLDHMNGGGD